MSDERLNGSVNILADAMRQVFSEAVEGAVEPLHGEMRALRTDMRDMEGRLNERIDTTNENVQSQLAQNRQDVANDVKDALTKS